MKLRSPDAGRALRALRFRAVMAESFGIDTARLKVIVFLYAALLAGLVAEEDLPEKLFIVHQFTAGMVKDRDQVIDRPGLATTFHIDGFGGRFAKTSKYQQLRPEPPFASGFKLFYGMDTDLLGPADVMTQLRPPPDLVTYQ